MSNPEQTAFSSPHDEGRYDYIIVGAGAAGCVLANRLGEDPGVQILVIEAGGSDNSVIVSMPAALSIPMNTKRFNWGMKTEPEPGLDGRQVNLPRGKGLGGSSSINGMCWVRGNPMDYELWEALGPRAGAGRTCFLTSSAWKTSRRWAATRDPGADAHQPGASDQPALPGLRRSRQRGGVRRQRQHEQSPARGLRPDGDERRRRTSHEAARAYLRPAIARGNVRVIKGGLVDRVMFVGQRASGVVFSVAGKPARAMATREVILSAGAIMSPVILKRSGIGPAQELAQHGIAVIHDAPEVGENLMDHMELYLQMECTQPVSLFPTQSLLGKARIGIEWLATRRGLGATNHFERRTYS